MKIRLVIENAFVGGGTARTVASTASALARRGHDVELVSFVRRRAVPTFEVDPRVKRTVLVDEYTFKKMTPPAARAKRAGYEARRLLSGQRALVLRHRGDYRTAGWSPYHEAVFIRWLRSVRDGVLVGTRPSVNLAIARVARPGLVRVAQDHLNLSSYKPVLRSSFQRHYPKLDAVVTLTERDAEEYRELLDTSRGLRVLTMPNGVPDLGGHRATLEDKVVISAGRLSPQKAYDRLLTAWAKVAPQRPDWRLEIYGAGQDQEKLQRQLTALGLGDSAQLMGRTSELFAKMAGASMFVMTSRREGMPMVLLEAMGVGLPVVAYDCPTGPRELIADGVDGYVVPNGDTDALVARIIELMDDPEKRKRYGEAARAKAAGYDVDALAERWERIFEELTAAKRR